MNSFVTIIVPAATVAEYRKVAGAWATGVGMFETALAAVSDPTVITAYISSGMIDSQVAALMADLPAFTNTINQLLGTAYTVADMQSLSDAQDHTSEPPLDAMARLGLVMWSDPNAPV